MDQPVEIISRKIIVAEHYRQEAAGTGSDSLIKESESRDFSVGIVSLIERGVDGREKSKYLENFHQL